MQRQKANVASMIKTSSTLSSNSPTYLQIEPSTYTQAKHHVKWRHAMDNEVHVLFAN